MPNAHTAVPDGDTGHCDTCGLPLHHPAHVQPAIDVEARILPPVTAPAARVRLHAPSTSHKAAQGAVLRAGTVRAQVFATIAGRITGATDDEVEVLLDRTHQSVSAARNSLAADGWIEPMTDHTGHYVHRRTRTGHDAHVWVPTPAARAQMPAHEESA